MSVYGKKIVIDGVEYVAVPHGDACDCTGCVFEKNDRIMCRDVEKLSMKHIGKECALGEFIFKKVKPKKSTNHAELLLKTEKSWGQKPKDGLPAFKFESLIEKKPEMQVFLCNVPYLRPFAMMDNQTEILIDEEPHTIVQAEQRIYEPGRSELVLTFRQGRGNLVNKNNQYIVCLSESGEFKPSESPRIHKAEESALDEAVRLCKKHNQKFVVLKVCHEVEPEVRAVTKKV